MLKIEQKLVNVANNITVLYAEDEKDTREQYASIFKLFYKDVKAVENGALALECYKNKKYDLLITDLTMPIVNGVELIDEIIKINPEQHVIIMTAHNTDENLKNSIDFQVDGILLKPVSVDKLFSMLYKVSHLIDVEKNSIQQSDQSDELTNLIHESDQAFFLVVIDKLHDIIKKFGIDTKKNIMDAVREHMSNFGVEENHIINIYDDVIICGVCKNYLDDILEAVQAFSSHNNNLIIKFDNLKFYITLSYGVVLISGTDVSSKGDNFLAHINSIVDSIKNDENSSLVIKMDVDIEEAKRHSALGWLGVTLDAIKQETIVPFYQPIVDINTLETVSYEVFARIKQGDKYILPELFIDLSKKAGILEELSHSVFKKSFQTLSATNFDFHINLTDVDWKNSSIKEYLVYLSSQYKIDANRVVLNIMNHEILKISSPAIKKLLELKELGYKISLKGFATGNINIELLSVLKPDYIKINQLLLQKSLENQHIQTALSFLLDYIKGVNIKSILVGVEKQEILNEGKRLGFDYVKGYFIREPLNVL